MGPVSVKLFTDLPGYTGQPFNLPFSIQEVHKAFKALKALDHRKSSGPDLIDSYFLKPVADFVAEPLTNLFNLTVEKNEIPSVWKSAFVLPLLKGVDPAILTNYRPISNLSVLAKVLESSCECASKGVFTFQCHLIEISIRLLEKKHSTITASTTLL